jgi:hypothetical protein
MQPCIKVRTAKLCTGVYPGSSVAGFAFLRCSILGMGLFGKRGGRRNLALIVILQ